MAKKKGFFESLSEGMQGISKAVEATGDALAKSKIILYIGEIDPYSEDGTDIGGRLSRMCDLVKDEEFSVGDLLQGKLRDASNNTERTFWAEVIENYDR